MNVPLILRGRPPFKVPRIPTKGVNLLPKTRINFQFHPKLNVGNNPLLWVIPKKFQEWKLYNACVSSIHIYLLKKIIAFYCQYNACVGSIIVTIRCLIQKINFNTTLVSVQSIFSNFLTPSD